MKKKLLIIQPHSDDALFSAASLMFDKRYDVSILTIENNAKRVKEDEELYKFLKIPYHHLTVEFDDQSFYSFHKKYASVTVANSYSHLEEFFGKTKVNEIRDEIEAFLKQFVEKHKDVQIVVPYGVGHPMHCFVRDVAERYTDGLWYYRDFPHSYKKRARHQMEEQSSTYKQLQVNDVKKFHDVKWTLIKKFYKTQSGVLWYEQGYIKKMLPEEIYIKK